MTMVESFPETIISMSDEAICSRVGFTIKLLSTLPTLTVAIGPAKGISDTIRAAEAPTPASTSAIFSPSLDIAVTMTWVSYLKDLGNRGLNGLSVNLLVNISCSEGLASLLKKPPGILPPA